MWPKNWTLVKRTLSKQDTVPGLTSTFSTQIDVKTCVCVSKCIFHMVTNAQYNPHSAVKGKSRYYQQPSLQESRSAWDCSQCCLPKETGCQKPTPSMKNARELIDAAYSQKSLCLEPSPHFTVFVLVHTKLPGCRQVPCARSLQIWDS